MEHLEHTWSERRSTTLKDVARHAGVSESTASVIINGARSGTRVSPTTRRAVLDVAERLGYRPNSLARSLSSGRTNRIGIYSGRSRLDSRSPFFAELAGGVFDAAMCHGLNTLVHSSGSGAKMLLDLVSNRALDGLIVHAGHDDPILPLLGDLRVPAVAVADLIAGLPSVCVDDVSGGMLLARHLGSLGHKKAVYLQSRHLPSSALARQQAFEAACAEFSMRVVVDYVDWSTTDVLSPRAIEQITSVADPATAVIGWNDATAEAACRYLSLLGLSVPGDVAVVGFDGFKVWFAPRYELTTIRCPWSEVGKVATEALLSLVAGEPVPAVTTLPVEFVRGATT